MKKVKYFTPEEARKTLPLVKRILRDIISAGETMRRRAASIEGNVIEDTEIQNIATAINDYLNELEEIGCYYKDWNFTVGLVDFPSIIHGKEVMLCWRSDEEEIRYYHEADAGYSGRKLIPEEYFLHNI
ncbi:MAG: DUF2203 domain-containing protein [Ignavibacteria bacterium]|jgi:hypothetical protein|nr:DUF2203 domain-containing protein [Ignavibacteria bacterium]MCU7504337.1 DUF2203 domain-containing protein [Ignavibacteria bacterium]MCU7518182.1 DUF2203 domain-containing protein [Ignavibacteria bacterium]